MLRAGVFRGLVAALCGLGLAAAPRETAQYVSSYAPSERPGVLRISNTIKRSNCKRGGRAAKCTYSGRPLDGDGELTADVARRLKPVFNFPINAEKAAEIELPERLVQVLVHLSDTFEGAQICLVSGYRCFERGGKRCSKFQKKSSRHITAHAADITLLGIDNVDLATYALYLNENSEFKGQLGVGFYPNQSHVHVDVREKPIYWVDTSSSSEPPLYDKTKPHPMEAFFKHYDSRRAPKRYGRSCPIVDEHAEALSDDIESSAEPYNVRFDNILFTEPPLRGSPLSRRKFQNKAVDFGLIPSLDGLRQL